jgi:hypothetical protein
MKCRRKLAETLIEALLSCIKALRSLKASAHDEGVGCVICELLVLNDVSAAIKHSCGHRVNDAWLICTLQGSDEIHVQSLKGTSE